MFAVMAHLRPAGLLGVLLAAGCGSVATTPDAGTAADAAPGLDAPPGPPDAAWPAQATVTVDGPDTVDGGCPFGSFAVTLAGPPNTPLTLTMTVSDGSAVGSDLSGPVTLGGDGLLTTSTDIVLAQGATMQLTIDAMDGYGRVSTGSDIVVVTGGGPACAAR